MIKKNWLVIAIISFITICTWVVFDILHTRSKVELSPKIQEVIEPINPEFDTKGFE